MDIRDLSKIQKHVFFCNGDACTLKGSIETTKSIRAEIKKCGLHKHIHTTKTLCNSRCEDGPVIMVYPDNTWYKEMTPEVAETFVQKHLINNEVFENKLLYKAGSTSIYSNSVITIG
ncbi:MAG: NAD(P)H-dependent oxidoreductase subunit E [Bacteroidetes bacterium]|nr:NAD(P)H-dependent oxidoreductase subunit E [Bacteroidota bacterium]